MTARAAQLDSASVPWRLVAGGLAVRIRVTPKASRDAVEGLGDTIEGPALKVRVRAVPQSGEANAAVEALLADWLGVPKTSVTVTSGGKSRVKMLSVAGDGAALAATASARIGDVGTVAERKGNRRHG